MNDFIKLYNVNGTTLSGIYKIYQAPTANTIILNNILSDPGTYTGGGTIARVPVIDILSKEWNPYKQLSKNCHLLKILFGVDRTSDGEITIDYYPSHSEVSMIAEANATGSQIGTNILETKPYPLVAFESNQSILWHTVYFQGEGDSIQIRMYLSDDQMLDSLIAESDFILEGLILYTQPARVL